MDREKTFKREETVNGLNTLENKLNELVDKYKREEKINAQISLENFIKDVTRLKDKYKN